MNDELNFNLTPSYEVRVKFPNDLEKLINTLDWLWNGEFASFHMPEDMIQRARDAGVDIEIKGE
jgi:hypothetical protein